MCVCVCVCVCVSCRNFLGTSSGFQSVQFRVLENKLGIKRSQRIRYRQEDYRYRAQNEAMASSRLSCGHGRAGGVGANVAACLCVVHHMLCWQ